MTITYSSKLGQLPPYLFAEITRLKNERIDKGVDVIDLGVGDPDLSTPDIIVRAAQEALATGSYQKYPFTLGLMEYRQAIIDWFGKRFGVSLDPVDQVCPLLGSKEGIAHIPLAFLEPGDYVLSPDPYYPAYVSGTVFAGGNVYFMPLKRENNFLVDLDAIPESIARKARIMFINYPNNPTSALATENFFIEVVEFAKKYNVIIAHDNAYSELCFDGIQAPSFLETPGALEVGIEFHSLSKTFSMTGWRIGFAVGNASIIRGLTRVKSNVDTGLCLAIQKAGSIALHHADELIPQTVAIYQKRRDILVEGLRAVGFETEKPKGTLYVWVPVPEGYGSMNWTKTLLEKTGVVVTPGVGLGQSAEGWFRIAMMAPEARLLEAVERFKSL
ncbi:MAG: LL-diaminopimelate aminotransferase [Candidatus Cloacimonetes bacterium 4572_55]|nr:MAG: LL-diaminopimelate aminotransferase [Candidatus Cloacimonetes bacterium 4572_55]